MATAHSLKALKTLELMRTNHTGWKVPPMTWVPQIQSIPVKVPCAACHGRGRSYQTTPPYRFSACETCNAKGFRVELRDAEVMVGKIDWPAGTQFTSRFGGDQCGLCGKRIINPWSWQPVVGRRDDGAPLGMFVGTECATHILSMNNQRMSVELVYNAATGRSEAARIWRELPKPPKPVKPAKPLISGRGRSRKELTQYVSEALAPLEVWSVSYYDSAATAELHLCLKNQELDTRDTYDLRITARHGASLKTFDRATLRDRPVWRDKSLTDVGAAIDAALVALRRDVAR